MARGMSFLRMLFGASRVMAPPLVHNLDPGELIKDVEVIPEGFREERLTGENLERAVQEAMGARRILSVQVTQVVGSEIVVLLGSNTLGNHLYGVMPPSEFDDKLYKGYEGTVGELVDVLIVGYDARRRMALVSRKQARAIKRAAVLGQMKVGAVLTGLVRSIRPFGAFLDVGGLHVILPVNEISHEFVQHPGDVLRKGQLLQVRLLAFDPVTLRTRVSIKGLTDAWATVGSLYKQGAIVLGAVSGVQGEQLWVRPQPYHGVEILCPVMPNRTYTEGERVRAKLSVVDPVKRRLRGRVVGRLDYQPGAEKSMG